MTSKADERQNKRLRSLEWRMRELSREELEDRRSLRRLLLRNFLGGIMRGVGTTIGIALVGTVGVYLLTKLAENDMPGLGEFIAEVVRWVQKKL